MGKAERIRKFAEDYTILCDDLEMACAPAGEVIANIHFVEEALLSGNSEDARSILEWLKAEVVEYDGDEYEQQHANEAKRLLCEYFVIIAM